jgi:hypothetical protein
VHSKAVLACWDLLKDLVGSFFLKDAWFSKELLQLLQLGKHKDS